MGVGTIVAKAKQAGVTLYLREGQLRYRGIRQTVELLLPELRVHKAEIIEALIHVRRAEGTDSVGKVGRRGVENGREGAALQGTEGYGRSLAARLTPAQTRADNNPLLNGGDPQHANLSGEQQAVSDAKRQALEERLAIMEYDGGLSREEAKRWAADEPQFATRTFLYSVIREGRVERGTLVSQDIRTEPAATQHLRQRFPWLKVQWVQLITHPVCAGCQHYTGGVLCNADRSPERAAKVGQCGKYEAARSVSEARP